MPKVGVQEYKVPLTWEVYGYVCVKAESKEAAIEYALGPDCHLPQGNYVDDSVRVDDQFEVEEV